MPTFWDVARRDDLCRRVERLTAGATARWGSFTVAEMVAHLNDALRMATGDLPVAPRNLPIRYFPLKQLIIYALPFPKGAPTAPELLARGREADLKAEQMQFRGLAERAAAKPSDATWPEHPAFGRLTHKAWGVLVYRHTDHHLKQFGV
jgi:hypothetical protein